MSAAARYAGTCSVERPYPGCLTFARDEARFLRLLERAEGIDDLAVIVPHTIAPWAAQTCGGRWNIMASGRPDWDFALLHNEITRERQPLASVVSLRSEWHHTAVIADGLHLAVGPNGERVHLHHMGNVVIEDGVRVGALTVIERGVLDSTTLHRGAQIDARVLIGHQADIGERAAIAAGAIIGGSARIGADCWIGLNATVRNGASICPGAVVAMGAAVTKDITEPGIYGGVPARRLADAPQEFNF